MNHFFTPLFGALFLLVASAQAQDSHYATNQFGTRSSLMGGAVLGFTKDNSSLYYNPGTLAFIDSNSITIIANAYQYENFSIENAAHNQSDLYSTRVGSVPLLVSGMHDLNTHRFKIGHGVVSPIDFTFKTTSRIAGKFAVVDDAESPGLEEFIGQSSINSELGEITGILSMGYKLSANWGIGISNFFTGRTQDFSRATYARFYLNTPETPLSGYSFGRNVSYFHLRYNPKIGVSYRKGRLSAGLTVVPPSVRLMGGGTITADVIGTNILFNGKRTSLLANDRQESVPVYFQAPLSVAAGANYSHKRSTFGVSMQFHAGQKLYTVMDARPSELIVPVTFYESLGNQDFLRLKDGARPVVNFSVGYEYAIRKNVALLGSLRTNRSYYRDDLDDWKGIKTQITTWNIYHLVFGGTVKEGHSQLSLGLMLGMGADGLRKQNGEFSQPDETTFFQSTSGTSRARYHSVSVLLGYTFMLFDI